MRFPKLAVPAALTGVGFAAATLGAYLLTRTVGLLGLEDNQLSAEAVVELVALGVLVAWLVAERPLLRPAGQAA